MRSLRWFTFSFSIPLLIASSARAEIVLPKIIGNNMVLQRGTDAPIWGTAAPGEKISVRGDWQKRDVITTADKNGKWLVKLPTPGAGKPHTITIAGKNKIVLTNVLMGEVWICSGQSNMEMPVGDVGWGYRGVTNWEEELKNANFPDIRLFTVANTLALSPNSDCEGSWAACDATTAKTFSAVGYFFGRELHQSLNVPIGLISADWGGTVAEAWTSECALKTIPDFANDLKSLAQERDHSEGAAKDRAATISNWIKLIESADGIAANASVDLDDSSWSVTPLLGQWTGDLAKHDGFVWFRQKFQLSADWQDRDLILELGAIDDADFTYINGAKVGQTLGDESWIKPRVYRVPKALFKSGENIIAVRVLDNGGPGGIYGPAKLRLADAEGAISLDKDWRYKIGAEITTLPKLNLPQKVSANTPTVLFNGMISPLVPFAIRGAIWYQGESNIGRDEQYRRLFPALIRDWRQHWNQGDFPFYFVQLAPYRYGTEKSAALREAQFLTLSSPNTGMAVTMDIGNASDIHPNNKQDVGRRLSLWALAKTYGHKRLVYSGPLYKKMSVEGNRVRIFFNHVGSELTSSGKDMEHFEIASANGNFVPAQVKIDGKTILVSSDAVSEPVAVRYGWSDTAESSFGNKEGLPASPFRTGFPGR